MFKAGDIQSHWCSCRDLHLFIIVCGESLYTETGFGEHVWWLLIDCYVTDVLTTTTSTLMFFHYCCYPRGLAEHLRLYLKASRWSVSAECNLCKPFVHVILSFEAFPLHRVFLFTCTKLVAVLFDFFFFFDAYFVPLVSVQLGLLL